MRRQRSPAGVVLHDGFFAPAYWRAACLELTRKKRGWRPFWREPVSVVGTTPAAKLAAAMAPALSSAAVLPFEAERDYVVLGDGGSVRLAAAPSGPGRTVSDV